MTGQAEFPCRRASLAVRCSQRFVGRTAGCVPACARSFWWGNDLVAVKNDVSVASASAPSAPLVSVAPFFIGLRYLLRKKLSYLAMVGVAIGVGTLIVVMSVMTGFSNQLKGVIRGYLSDLTVLPLTGKLYGMEEWQALREKALNVDHVDAVAPFVQGYGFIYRRSYDGEGGHMKVITFKGVHPELERGVSELDDYVIEKEGLGGEEGGSGKEGLRRLEESFEQRETGGRVRSCFIGEVLAGWLQIPPGEVAPLTLVTVSGRGLSRRVRMFAVNGVFKTGEYEYDSMWVITSLSAAQSFVASDGGVSGLHVKLDDFCHAPQVVAELGKALGEGYSIETWEDQRRPFLDAVAMERFLQAVIMSFIMVLAGFCIFAILSTTVHEKRRDIGALKAVGFRRGQIASIFLLAGLCAGVIGSALGVTGGMLFTAYINEIEQFIESLTGFTPFPQQVYYFDRIPTDSGPAIPAVVAIGALVCCLIFSVFPALKAARLDPIETLHFE